MEKKLLALTLGLIVAFFFLEKVFVPRVLAPALLTVPDYPRTLNGRSTTTMPRPFGSPIRVTTFDTADSPDAVRAFYARRLFGIRPFWGWRIISRPDVTNYYWDCAKWVELQTKAAAGSGTRVEIREADDHCL